MMTINEYIMKYRDIQVLKDFRGTDMEKDFEDGIMRRIMNPYVICKDDFTFSAQASYTHYSNRKALRMSTKRLSLDFLLTMILSLQSLSLIHI